MDAAVHTLLLDVQKKGLAKGHWLGLLNVLIGRKITKGDAEVCNGMTWRALAALLKKAHWDREIVREAGLDPEQLPPRDRVQFWYSAIARSGVDGPAATAAGNETVKALAKLGYVVGPAPGQAEAETEE